jgi:signal transduction histidine kinase
VRLLDGEDCKGKKITCLASTGFTDKVDGFLKDIKKSNFALNYEVPIKSADGKYMFIFSGIRIGKKILVIATDSFHLFNDLFEEMTRIANEQTNIVRKLEKEKAEIARVERERIERDLHDSVSQTLFSTRIIAEILPSLWEKDRKEAKAQLEKIKLLTEESLTEMRRILLELKPDAFEEEDLNELLNHLVKSIKLRSNINIKLSIQGSRDIEAKVKETIYRIAQEATNNAIKHSNADHINIELKCLPKIIKLTVEDNGKGFDINSVPGNKFGLHIMNERAKLLGADIKIKGTKNKGTKVVFKSKS